MRPLLKDQNPFLELERVFYSLDKLESVARRTGCVRRTTLTALLAGGTVLLAMALGSTRAAIEVADESGAMRKF